MVWVYDKEKHRSCNLHLHRTKSGRRYVMRRKRGGGTKRVYLRRKRR